MYKLFDIQLQNPISNASGVLCSTRDELDILANSKLGYMVTKSCTLRARLGNSNPRFWMNNDISINSMGLPNNGYQYYIDWIRDNYKKKPILLSIANINNDDTSIILDNIYGLDYIYLPEINVSCTNIMGKSQLAYDFNRLNEFLIKIVDNRYYNKPFGLKLPPYFDPIHIEEISKIIEHHHMIKYITCCNSIGNTLILDEDKNPVIRPKSGLGGLGGKYMKPIGLSNVYQFKKRLPNIDIIGCGGISDQNDIDEYISVGSSCIQIGTALWRDGIKLLDNLKYE